MAYIAKELRPITGSCADKLAKDHELVWKSLFELEKMKQLKKKWKFSQMITTDGVGVSILFERNIPTPPNMKIPKTDPVFLNAFDRGLLWESQVKFEPEATSSQHYRFIAIDPGIKNPVTSVDMLDGSRYRLFQAHYNSLFRSHNICRKKLEHKYGGRAFVTDFNKLTPGAKTSVNQEVFEEYVRLLGKHWTNRWTIASHHKLLQSRFQTRRRREKFLDKLTNNLLVPSTSNLALGLHNKKKQPEKNNLVINLPLRRHHPLCPIVLIKIPTPQVPWVHL